MTLDMDYRTRDKQQIRDTKDTEDLKTSFDLLLVQVVACQTVSIGVVDAIAVCMDTISVRMDAIPVCVDAIAIRVSTVCPAFFGLCFDILSCHPGPHHYVPMHEKWL